MISRLHLPELVIFLSIVFSFTACEKPVEDIPVATIAIAQDTAEMTEGESLQLKAVITPENATNKTVTWTSSNTSVASISDDGIVTALSEGTSTIYAMAETRKAQCVVSVRRRTIPVSSVSLDKTSVEIVVGGSATLSVSVSPDNASDKSVFWSSSDESVATVKDGVINAISVGSATVSARSGEISANCTVVVKPIEVSSLTLDKTDVELLVGDSATLTASITPENATDKSVTWSSSDESVATVSLGEISAVGVGSAIITAKAGDKTADCKVVVKPVNVTSVSLNYSSIELIAGGEKMLSATVLPENATDKSLIWKSSDEGVATVEDGLVKAKNTGSATISVETNDGHFTSECQVKVQGVATSISLSMDSFMGDSGASYPISVITEPSDAACDISWSSSNNSIARVNGYGKDATITVASGYYTHYTTITATDRLSGKSASIKVANTVSDFTWTENTGKTYAGSPLVTIAVGESYQLQYSCFPWPIKNVFGNKSNLVFYEPSYAVENPSNISLDPNGVVTGIKVGTTGIKPTGAIIKMSGGVSRVYIEVVDSYSEEEPNNDFPYATTIKPGMPMKFNISTTTDVDVFKFTNPVGTSGQERFKISLVYSGDQSSKTSKVLRWELYNNDYTLFGSGTLNFAPEGSTYELTNWLNTSTGFLKFYFPTNYYNYPEMRPTGTLTVDIKK